MENIHFFYLKLFLSDANRTDLRLPDTPSKKNVAFVCVCVRRRKNFVSLLANLRTLGAQKKKKKIFRKFWYLRVFLYVYFKFLYETDFVVKNLKYGSFERISHTNITFYFFQSWSVKNNRESYLNKLLKHAGNKGG